MTDFGAPTTPGDALREFAESTLKPVAERYRRDAALLLAKADAVDSAVIEAEAAARQYDRWQPAPPDDGRAPT